MFNTLFSFMKLEMLLLLRVLMACPNASKPENVAHIQSFKQLINLRVNDFTKPNTRVFTVD